MAERILPLRLRILHLFMRKETITLTELYEAFPEYTRHGIRARVYELVKADYLKRIARGIYKINKQKYPEIAKILEVPIYPLYRLTIALKRYAVNHVYYSTTMYLYSSYPNILEEAIEEAKQKIISYTIEYHNLDRWDLDELYWIDWDAIEREEPEFLRWVITPTIYEEEGPYIEELF